MKDWGGEDVLFINRSLSHSQSQGLVEQGNATIMRHIANKHVTLRLTGDYLRAGWLPKIQYNMNTEIAGGTKTPYEVFFGQPPRTTIMPGETVKNEVINEEDLNFELNPAAEDTVESQDTFSVIERPTSKPRIANPAH